MDVGAWLRGLGLGQYERAFRDNDVDVRVLPGLTAEGLKEIGVASVGHRRLMLQAIAGLSAVTGPAAPATAHEAVSVSDADAPARAERRQLTVLFADLVGSTALSARLDPEEMATLLKAYQNTVAGEITRHGGHVAKFMGDGVLAYFGWPRAHEDGAERAVQSGLGIARAVAALPSPGGRLAARIGIATGLVVVGELIGEGAAREEAVVGGTPNLAARLQGLAAPGQVVVAESTRRLLGTGFAVEDRGLETLKGFAEPVAAFRVLGEQAVESRFAARHGDAVLPMAGRDEELALLLRHWRQVLAGDGQAVLLLGEAGIGKSRLVRALRDAVARETPATLLYQCSPLHADSPLWPVGRQLELAAGLRAGDSAGQKRAKLANLLAKGTSAVDESLALLAPLLGVPLDPDPLAASPPEERRRRTLDVLVDQLTGLAQQDPVLVLFEDVHWLDATSLDLLRHALDAVANARVLLVLTSRHDAVPTLGDFPHLTSLSLHRLGQEAAAGIVAALAETRPLPEELRREILSRSDGIPLFVEELTKAVLEAGPARAGTAVPTTLQDSLLARLDRSAAMKAVAQMAACIGRDFDRPLLEATADLPAAELASGLDELVRAGLVFRRGAPSAAGFSFKHALVRDAAYRSLLRQHRRAVHGRIARALEKCAPDEGRAQPELVARHYEHAGLAEAALGWWDRAARQALERHALAEGVSHLGRALEALRAARPEPDGGELELQLLLRLGVALSSIHGGQAPQTRRVFEETRDRAVSRGDSAVERDAVAGLYGGAMIAGEVERGLELAAAYARTGDPSAEPLADAMGKRMRGAALFLRGDLVESERLLADAATATRRLARSEGTGLYFLDPHLSSLTCLSQTLALSGRVVEAAETAREALERVSDADHFNARAHTLAFAAMAFAFMRLGDEAARITSMLEALCRKHGARFWLMPAGFTGGVGRLAMGDAEAAARQLAASLEAFEAQGCRQFAPYFLAAWAEAELATGRTEVALGVLDRASLLAAATGQRFADAEVERVRAAAAIGRGDVNAAAGRLRVACEIAHAQGARLLELRASISLARLLAGRGEDRQARDFLYPVHASLAGGLDTPDLQDAATLLSHLH